MRIALIGLKESEVNIFPELGKALGKKISGVELIERFAPVAEDLPLIALEAAQENDFIVVFAPIDDDEMADFVKKKLVDVELATKTRILKIVDSEYISGDDNPEFEDGKELVVSGIVETVVNILFNEKAFEPKDREFE